MLQVQPMGSHTIRMWQRGSLWRMCRPSSIPGLSKTEGFLLQLRQAPQSLAEKDMPAISNLPRGYTSKTSEIGCGNGGHSGPQALSTSDFTFVALGKRNRV